MWYVFQAVTAFTLAFVWTTAPGNGPEDFGRGLFLGGLFAWWLTWVLTLLFDAIRRLFRSHTIPVGGSKKCPDQIVT
jgi:hypothetical protein